MVRSSIAAVLAFSFLLGGCKGRQPAADHPAYDRSPVATNAIVQYSLGVPAIRHVRSLWDRYSELTQVLNNSGTGFVLKLESGQTADSYDTKLRGGLFDFAIVDPYQVLVAEDRGYSVIARTGKPDRIRGVIVIARDSEIRGVRDLRTRTIAFTNPTALAATLLNQYDLFESGLDVRKRAVVVYTHSPETSLLSVALNRASAAAVSEADWDEFQQDHPDSAKALSRLRQTEALSGPAVMASPRIPPDHVRRLQAALLQLASEANGRAALERAGISGFRPGNSVSYDDVWDFLQRYKQALGPLPDRIPWR
ncbi:MAG TPA: phosphate/phosphite/phosphonate ABC transporter substrate-binding protein [Bryobacteraceae bacterium]|nr:phosphate/phosphite/phosphonate ABC transporter substrate-binding protein [Bryobacteraceae bacterium]